MRATNDMKESCCGNKTLEVFANCFDNFANCLLLCSLLTFNLMVTRRYLITEYH